MFQSGIFWMVVFFTTLIFWTLPEKSRLKFLAAVSIGYIIYLDLIGSLMLGFWVLGFWVLRKNLHKIKSIQNKIVPVVICAILMQLAYFKYLPDIANYLGLYNMKSNSAIPIGISFITFRLIHYLIESNRGNLPEHNFFDFLSWAFLFSIWTAGPIQRFDHFKNNYKSNFDSDDFLQGLSRIVQGLIKKFVISMQLLPLLFGDLNTSTAVISKLDGITTFELWYFLIVKFLILYMDFSAYSDIAIGTARLFGIVIMENFNFPILAQNITNYWKRWHMTLANWCQTYVYMPIIGHTRNPRLAVYCTFFTMGLWHAGSWHWIFWGLYHATGIIIYQKWLKFRREKGWTVFEFQYVKYIGIPITFLFVCGAGAFTGLHNVGTIGDSFKVFLKLVFIDI